MLVLVGCGKQKAATPCAAADLYVGGYSRLRLAYARTLAPDAAIRILSAKHGLLALDAVVAPYDLRVGDPGAIDGTRLKAQAAATGLLGALRVVVLAGEDYVALARRAWPHAQPGLPRVGMGAQQRWLKARLTPSTGR